MWSTTQHFAVFDVLVRGVLGEAHSGDGRFEDASVASGIHLLPGITVPVLKDSPESSASTSADGLG